MIKLCLKLMKEARQKIILKNVFRGCFYNLSLEFILFLKQLLFYWSCIFQFQGKLFSLNICNQDLAKNRYTYSITNGKKLQQNNSNVFV